jgi:hypothetical protein
MEKESMAVGSFHESGAPQDNSVGYDGRAEDAVVLCEQNSRQKIEMAALKVAERR